MPKGGIGGIPIPPIGGGTGGALKGPPIPPPIPGIGGAGNARGSNWAYMFCIKHTNIFNKLVDIFALQI